VRQAEQPDGSHEEQHALDEQRSANPAKRGLRQESLYRRAIKIQRLLRATEHGPVGEQGPSQGDSGGRALWLRQFTADNSPSSRAANATNMANAVGIKTPRHAKDGDQASNVATAKHLVVIPKVSSNDASSKFGSAPPSAAATTLTAQSGLSGSLSRQRAGNSARNPSMPRVSRSAAESTINATAARTPPDCLLPVRLGATPPAAKFWQTSGLTRSPSPPEHAAKKAYPHRSIRHARHR